MKAAFLSGSLISSKGLASPATRSQPPQDLLSKRQPVQQPVPARNAAPNRATTTRSVKLSSSTQAPLLQSRSSVKPKLKKPTASSVDAFRTKSENMKKDNTGRVRMSIRMAPDDHLLLKLLAAHSKQSAQSILETALQEYAERHGEKILPESCNCIRNQIVS